MKLSASQGQHQVQSPLTSAHIAQTMSLLYMTSTELLQTIDVELSKNPALELIKERRCPMCGRKLPLNGPCLICSQPKSNNSEETIVFVSPREDFYQFHGQSSRTRAEIPEASLSPNNLDLPTYVLRQVAPDLEISERQIAAMILSNLNKERIPGNHNPRDLSISSHNP